MTPDYKMFLERKSQISGNHGFDPIWMPDFLFAVRGGCKGIGIELKPTYFKQAIKNVRLAEQDKIDPDAQIAFELGNDIPPDFPNIETEDAA